MKKIVNKLYNNGGGQFFMAALVTAVCYAVLALTHDIYWVMIDDNESTNVLSGCYSGTPSFAAPFVNAFLGYIFQFLYNITTAIQWYPLFHIFIIIISSTVIFKFLFMCFSRKNVNVLVPLIISVITFFAVFTRLTVYMVFTINSIMIGCGAIASLFIANFNKGKKIRYFEYTVRRIY